VSGHTLSNGYIDFQMSNFTMDVGDILSIQVDPLPRAADIQFKMVTFLNLSWT
jgi:hypothetical protein